MKIRLTALLALTAAASFAQQDAPPPTGADVSFNPISLGSEFFEKNNFFNYYLFANAVYDSYNPTLSSTGARVNNGGVGYQIGGGASVRHVWRRSVLSFAYSGDYRDYSSAFFSSGTDQSLGLAYNQQISRHLTLGVNVSAGNILYGTGYFGQQPAGTSNVQLNPFSNSTRFLSSGVSLTYQQTRRLSYSVSGGLYLQRYSFSGAVGSTGGSGGAAVNYRVTSRTTVSGSYGYSYFVFQRNAGTSAVNTIAGSISHRFKGHWVAGGSGGVSYSHVTGTITLPVSLLVNGVTLAGYETGPYDTKSTLPSFSGYVTRFLRQSSFSVSGGQSVVSGNGYYLASKNQFLSGLYSRNFYKSNASIGGSWNRLNSVANSIAYAYSTTGISASYSRVVGRHIAFNGRYDFVRYGNLNPFPATSDNRLTFGVAYTSQSVPLGLY